MALQPDRLTQLIISELQAEGVEVIEQKFIQAISRAIVREIKQGLQIQGVTLGSDITPPGSAQ